jgi:hypothetical protein
MKKIDAWMLAGFLGLLGAGCGAPANDSQPAGIDAEQRIKTTVVTFLPGGQREIFTYYATPQQIELEEQQLLDAQRRLEEGEELAAIVPTSCSSPTSVWAYDVPGAGKYQGYARCCLGNDSDPEFSQAYIADVCAFPEMASLRSHGRGGLYGDQNDCQVEFGYNKIIMYLACNSPVNWIGIYGPGMPH